MVLLALVPVLFLASASRRGLPLSLGRMAGACTWGSCSTAPRSAPIVGNCIVPAPKVIITDRNASQAKAAPIAAFPGRGGRFYNWKPTAKKSISPRKRFRSPVASVDCRRGKQRAKHQSKRFHRRPLQRFFGSLPVDDSPLFLILPFPRRSVSLGGVPVAPHDSCPYPIVDRHSQRLPAKRGRR